MAGPTAPPPAIDGFAHERLLGSGGFADVYLYRDTDLDRPVAIKVLRSTIDDAETRDGFIAESKLMAKVSGHPYIVQIYSNGVAADGRPYLVMQYYSGESYGNRIRARTLSVAETLEVGVHVSSALEAAHRAGIVHRDVKPSNLLTDDYGKPGLTDFGIAGAVSDGSLGFSPPYAPPEVVMDETAGDARGDVFSLSATLYALLAGRSPFESSQGDNTRTAVTARVLNDHPFPLGRDDVASTLERLLAQGLSKDPETRPSSALAFGRSLQAVQQSLQHTPTPLTVEDDRPGSKPGSSLDPTDEDRTRFGGVKVIDPDQVPLDPAQPVATGPAVISGVPDTFGTAKPIPREFQAQEAILPAPIEDGTVVRVAPSPTVPSAPAPETKRSVPVWQIIAGVMALLVVAIGTVVVLASGSGTEPSEPDAPAVGSGGDLIIITEPDAPTSVVIAREADIVEISWSVTNESAGDIYQVTYRVDGGDPMLENVDEPTLLVEGVPAGSRLCAEVVAVRSGRFSGASPMECSDV